MIGTRAFLAFKAATDDIHLLMYGAPAGPENIFHPNVNFEHLLSLLIYSPGRRVIFWKKA